MRCLALALAAVLLAATAPAQRTASATIRKLTVEKLTTIPPTEQQRIVAHIKAGEYYPGTLQEIGNQVAEGVRDELMHLGYFKAIVYDPTVTLVRQDARGEIVDVLVAADEGVQYRLQDLAFKGGKAFPPEQLRRLMPLNPGDVLDIYRVRSGMKNLRELYLHRGYVNFIPVPNTQLDDGRRTVSLTIDLDEGPVFYVGKLAVGGEESQPGAREKLLRAWHNYEGQRYDPEVLDRFLRDVHARPGLKPDEVFETSVDEVNHVVNASMTLAKPYQ